jgi:beta-N-acetylhexosaminidase
MKKSVIVVVLWLLGLAFTFAGLEIHAPFLIFLSRSDAGLMFVASLVVLAFLIRRKTWREIGGKLLILLWCLPALSMLYAHAAFWLSKRNVPRTEASAAYVLGQHFIIGYSSFAEVATLAEKGLIAGIYITRHNVAGRTGEAIKSEISELQARRRAAGLPPLIIAADQEGGIVSHLSPPLTAQPALATLADLPPDNRGESAEKMGRVQGKELASLGVNLDFAPVLDLKPAASHKLDFNTLIDKRAISDDPDKVAQVALAYVRGLDAFGIRATMKHFPGLGRVGTDTHHFAAKLDAPVAELEETDWRPFREVLAASNALIMVGHVTLTAVDPDRPASHSKRVIDGIIRKKWNYQGVVITDDLVMGAVYNHLCTAVVEALNAGVDLLLVAYDGSQFYRAFDCASDAFIRHELDMATLHDSEARLRRAFWKNEPGPSNHAGAVISGTAGRHAAGFSNPAKSDRQSGPSAVEFD